MHGWQHGPMMSPMHGAMHGRSQNFMLSRCQTFPKIRMQRQLGGANVRE